MWNALDGRQYKIQLDARYKLPRLSYRGDLPPPQHYIRKTQTPIIQEVASGRGSAAPTADSPLSLEASTQRRVAASNPSSARVEICEVVLVTGERVSSKRCARVPAVNKSGTALSPDVLAQAGDALEVTVSFEAPVTSADDVSLKLQPELLSVTAFGHHDLSALVELVALMDGCHLCVDVVHRLRVACLPGVFLPYPVVLDSAHVALCRAPNFLRVSMAIDKAWDASTADQGSAPWLLAQALRSDDDVVDSVREAAAPERASESVEPRSLAEMFHLELSDAREDDARSFNRSSVGRAYQKLPAKWDPVDDDEELPEDRFHRKDMLSMHILDQRKAERAKKAAETDAKRRTQRAEVEEKHRLARQAGKTWREMYPNEPETTYVDMEQLVGTQWTTRLQREKETSDELELELLPTEAARQAAAAWSTSNSDGKLTLRSALAFELLE